MHAAVEVYGYCLVYCYCGERSSNWAMRLWLTQVHHVHRKCPGEMSSERLIPTLGAGLQCPRYHKHGRTDPQPRVEGTQGRWDRAQPGPAGT